MVKLERIEVEKLVSVNFFEDKPNPSDKRIAEIDYLVAIHTNQGLLYRYEHKFACISLDDWERRTNDAISNNVKEAKKRLLQNFFFGRSSLLIIEKRKYSGEKILRDYIVRVDDIDSFTIPKDDPKNEDKEWEADDSQVKTIAQSLELQKEEERKVKKLISMLKIDDAHLTTKERGLKSQILALQQKFEDYSDKPSTELKIEKQ